MCCTRKKANLDVPGDRNFDAELQISNFQELVESLQVKPVGVDELVRRKNQLLAMAEWNTPNKSNLTKLKTQCETLMRLMMGQVKDMSRGLKALVLVNTHLVEEVSAQNIKK